MDFRFEWPPAFLRASWFPAQTLFPVVELSLFTASSSARRALLPASRHASTPAENGFRFIRRFTGAGAPPPRFFPPASPPGTYAQPLSRARALLCRSEDRTASCAMGTRSRSLAALLLIAVHNDACRIPARRTTLPRRARP